MLLLITSFENYLQTFFLLPTLPNAVSNAAFRVNMADQDLKSSNSALPDVKDFEASTVTINELVDALKIAGGVIVRNLLTQEELDQIEADVRPWLDKDKPWEGTHQHEILPEQH